MKRYRPMSFYSGTSLMKEITIQTDRLLLRQWKENDYDVFLPYFQNEGFTKYLGGNKDEEAAWTMMTNYIGHWHIKGFGYWAVEEKSSGKFVGGCGLWKSPEWPEIELGYWILPPFHGKGYATEAAKSARAFAFETLNLPTLVSYIDSNNYASIKVTEKLDGKFDKTIELSSFGPHAVYRYSK